MLTVEKINRSFGSRHVLDDVSFTVHDQRMTGFVGGNGAGKTTTMRIILGVLSADSGSVSLGGGVIGARDRQRFGYMPEERGLYPKMKVAEQIVYLGRLHGMGPASAKKSAGDLLERLGLGERTNDTVESLSLGNQQRAQIAAALVHNPEVLILDEPFSGLDPIAVDTVQTVLKEHAAGGAPVLFSSHQLDIVERLCDDLVIIADGTIRANGSRDELREQYSSPQYEIEMTGDAGWVGEVSGVTVVASAEAAGGALVFETSDASSAQEVLRRALAQGPVTRFSRRQPSLAQIFREVIQ